MNNETLDTRLIREHTPEPLEGHSVVVFQRVGTAGERFHTVLPPGTSMDRGGLLKQMFSRRVDYFAYAVKAAPELRLDFSEHVVTADHAHEFDLLVDLYYCVEDPRLVATERNNDPLGSVRARVGAVLAAEIAQLPWNTLWHAFRAAADGVVHDNLRMLRSFAARYGIGIRAVELAMQLPEVETSTVRRVHRGISDVRMETELTRAQIEERETIEMEQADSARRLRLHGIAHSLNDAQAEDHALLLQHRRRLLENISSANSQALENIGNSIESGADWRDAIRAGKGALREMMAETGAQGLLANGGTAQLSLPGQSQQPPQQQGRLAALVGEISAATQDVIPTATRNSLCATLLHLTAEVLADGAGDPARRDEYARSARSAISSLSPAPDEDTLEALRRLTDPVHLRRALSTL
jgi:hypothetical protein